MRKYYLLAAIALIFSTSCNNKERGIIDNKYAEKREIKTNEFQIKADEKTLNSYYLNTTVIDNVGNEKIISYNYKTHALDIFDLESRNVTHLFLNTEGKDAVPTDVSGLYASTIDSIWLYSNGSIFLLDSKGVRMEKKVINNFQTGYIITNTNYSCSTINLFYNKKRNSLFYATNVSPDSPKFYVNELSIKNNKISQYELRYPSVDFKKPSYFGWKQLPNITFTDDYIIYNYPIESNIHRIDLETKKDLSFGGKSRFTENLCKKMDRKSGYNSAERHKIENIHFFEINYNKSLDIYYRFHVGAAEYQNGVDFFDLYQKKHLYLMIFDNKFRIINETMLNDNRYSLINAWGSLKHGIYIYTRPQINPKTIDLETDMMSFDIISIEK